MNKNYSNIFLFCLSFCFAIVFSNCSRSIYIPVRHAGEISLSSDIDSLIIVDNTIDAENGLTKVEKTLNGVTKGKVMFNNVVQKDDTFKTLFKFLDAHERFYLSSKDVLELNVNTADKEQTVKIVDSLCLSLNADGVIFLEAIENITAGGTPQGATSVPSVQTSWKMFDRNGFEVDNAILSAKGNLQSNEVYDKEDGVKVVYSPSAEVSILYLRRLAPCYYQENRTYYSKGSEELKLAADAMKLLDYKKAKYYWDLLLEQKNLKKKVLKRLAHNLALAYELEGDFETALLWVGRAVEKGNAPSLRYQKQLAMLLAEQPLIELQLFRE